jgi:hypothetical protein
VKSQRRLRLRRCGKHHNTDSRAWPEWAHRFGVHHNLVRAFEMNVEPRHYSEPKPLAYWQMDNYVTGIKSWHGGGV